MRLKIHELPPKIRQRCAILIACIASISAALVCFSIPSIGILEWRLADFWATQSPKGIADKVAVVGIDEEFLNAHAWPVEKDVYGDLIDFLMEMGAKTVVFDILFSDNLYSCGKSDSIFIAMLDSTPGIVLSCGNIVQKDRRGKGISRMSVIPPRFSIGRGVVPGFSVTGSILPYGELLRETRAMGFDNLAVPSHDGVDRKMQMVQSEDSLLFPSLSLAAASQFLGSASPAWDRGAGVIRLAGHAVPVDETGHLYVNFGKEIPMYTLSGVRAAHREFLKNGQPEIGRKQLEGRIIFIGNTANSLGDFGVSPLSKKDPLGRTPNVFMHARAAQTILDNSGIRFHGQRGACIFMGAIVLVLLVRFLLLSFRYSWIVVPIAFFAAYIISWRLYGANHFFPLLEGVAAGTVMFLLCSLLFYLEKELERRYLYTTFKTYLSPRIIDEMYEKQINPGLGGKQVHATAFFSDLENFSGFSEDMAATPAKIVDILNDYFSRMTSILIECNGTLDKFIGDAIVAFFGAPRPSEKHAVEACTTAVKMQEALAALRTEWATREELHEKVKTLKMRIGINTGNFVTGNIGGKLRMNYTMIGDAVNCASRLESACKEYGGYTVTGEETYLRARSQFLFRKLDKIRVKGRREPLVMYQLLGSPRTGAAGDDNLRLLIQSYEKALEIYLSGDFPLAAARFGESLKFERYPKDKNPSRVMMDRCEHFSRMMPKDWDGAFRT
jgi:adenylate cyclase